MRIKKRYEDFINYRLFELTLLMGIIKLLLKYINGKRITDKEERLFFKVCFVFTNCNLNDKSEEMNYAEILPLMFNPKLIYQT